MSEMTPGTPSGRQCPKCGKPTVWRKGRYSTFHGCPNYPACDGKIGAPRGKSSGGKDPGEQKKRTMDDVVVGDIVRAKDEVPGSLKSGETYRVTSIVANGGDIRVTNTNGKEAETGRWMRSRFDLVEQHGVPTGEQKEGSSEEEAETELDTEGAEGTGETEKRKGEAGAKNDSQNSLYALIRPHVLEDAEALSVDAATKVANATQEAFSRFSASVQRQIGSVRKELEEVRENAGEGGGTKKVEWFVNNVKFAEIEGEKHHALQECMRRIKANRKNLFLVGPAGTGKTFLAEQVAKALNQRFAAVSCTAGMSEAVLQGRAIPNLSTGETRYEKSAFVDFYENGGVFLLDEVDASDSNVLMILNSALANGHMNVPARVENPVAKRHADFYLICVGNTYGMGANRVYVGRNQLDGAFLNRFTCAVIPVGYDKKLEKQLVGDDSILKRVWQIRDKMESLSIRRIFGTRDLLAIRDAVASGETIDTALGWALEGWTEDEKTKVGVRA